MGRALRLAALVPLPLFSRLARDTALDHPRRHAIHEAVQQRPGIRFHELRDLLEIPHGSLMHHLRVLRMHGLVLWEREGRQLRLRTPGARTLRQPPREAADLLEACRRMGPVSLRDAARALGWNRRKATYWSVDLERRGLLVRARRGRESMLRLVAATAGVAAPSAPLAAPG